MRSRKLTSLSWEHELTDPQEPRPMSRGATLGYAIGVPLSLFGLIFLPAGSIRWWPGWIFLAVVIPAFGLSALVLARVNPIIYRARSRFQPGTKRWDRALVSVILPAIVAIVPVGALDAGRFHWSAVPIWLVGLGYAELLAGIAGTCWAQAVNPFFEPGVRIQSERHQRVIDTGPYRARSPPRLYLGAVAGRRHGAVAGVALGPCTGCARLSVAGRANLMGRPAAARRARRIRRLFAPGEVEARSGRLVRSFHSHSIVPGGFDVTS